MKGSVALKIYKESERLLKPYNTKNSTSIAGAIFISVVRFVRADGKTS